MKRPTLPASLRKYIRDEKSRLRKSGKNGDEYRELISQLYGGMRIKAIKEISATKSRKRREKKTKE